MAIRSRTRDILTRCVETRRPFRRGNLAGVTEPTPGELPAPWRALLSADLAAGRLRYAIMSYRTPIAWLHVDVDGCVSWRFPDVRYSVSTSAHQGAASWAIHVSDVDYDAPVLADLASAAA